MTGVLFIFIVALAIDLLAFLGVRLSLYAGGQPRRDRITALLYWLASAAVVCTIIAFLFFGPRNGNDAPQLPSGIIIILVLMYVPKTVIAALTLLDLILRTANSVARRALARTVPAATSWLARTRVLPRLGFALGLLTLVALLWGIAFGRNEIKIYEYDVFSETLPAEFDGVRIVHISDIHAENLGAGATPFVDQLVNAINAERPDLVVFTGDYGQPKDFQYGPDILGRLRASLGKFAVLGNHDFGDREKASDNWTSDEDKQRKIAALAREFGPRGFKLLVNDAAVVYRGSAAIAILGVGVFEPHHGFDDAHLAAAQHAAEAPRFRLLLAHSPEYWENFVLGRRLIDLTLVGHTHGAQVGVGLGSAVWSPAAIQFRYWGGLYRVGMQYLNVNRGIGYIGIPFRLNMPADISVITLRSERSGNTSGWPR